LSGLIDVTSTGLVEGLFQVVERIEHIRYPQAVIAILDKALEYGYIDLADIQKVLIPFQQKTYLNNYITFARRMLLIQSNGQSGIFYPSTRGRELYNLAQLDRTKAVRSMLASIPYYHLHAELLLARLILEASALRPHQLNIILNRIHSNYQAYQEDRLPWIQNQLGWTDSANISSEFNNYKRVLDDWKFIRLFIDRISLNCWDDILHLAGVSDLTKVDNLCQLLEEQQCQHFIIDSTLLQPTELGTLILLVLGQLEDRSLDLKTLPELIPALETLSKFGLNLHQNHHSTYLTTPVKVIFPESPNIFYIQESLQKFPVLQNLFRSFTNNSGWQYQNRDGTRRLKLPDLLYTVQSSYPHSLYIFDELSEVAKNQQDSIVEIWDKQRLINKGTSSTAKPVNSQFINQLLQIFRSGNEIPSQMSVILTNIQLECERLRNIESALANVPHLFLLVLLLIDHDQSGLNPILETGEWYFAKRNLLTVIDDLLRSFGFIVWDEWYANRKERNLDLTSRLVKLLLDFGIAHVNSNRLELTLNFQSMLLDEYAWLHNQTKVIRQRMRSIIENHVKEN
jgi:hypothetical protein